MHPKRNLLIFLLAVVGTDILVAMHPDEGTAGTSGSNTETEANHHNFDHEGAIDSVRVGSSGKPTLFLIVDTHEPDATYGSGYLLVMKDAQIRLGNQQLQSAIHKHKSPCAARIELTLTEEHNPGLKAPMDLEGIELEMEYGFLYHNSNDYWARLNNREMVKKVVVKIPKIENEPTERETEILKGIFIGGHKFRVEVQKDGNVEIKFQKNLSPGTTKFTASYKYFRSEQGKIVKASYSVGKNYGFEFESISKSKSTFTINWAAAGIKEAEELRAVEISINFKFSDEPPRYPHHRSIPLRDFKQDTLEQLYVGGEAKIHLGGGSGDYEDKSDIEIVAGPVKKPKKVLETVKAMVIG